MSHINRYIPFLASLLLLAACGESLEDTYKDYSGDGEIRYVGKVSDLEVSPGWKHIKLDWTNSTDPIVDQVEVKWSVDSVRDSVFLPKGTTEYDIQNIETSSSFEISVMSVDAKLHESLPQTVYSRAYNNDHELVQAFTHIVSRSFFLHNHMLMTFMGWDENVSDAYLTYTKKSDGQQARFDLTADVVNQLHADLPDVDATKPVQLYREGYLEGCPDLITFDPITVETETVFNSEFKTELKRQFGYDQIIPDDFVTGTTSFDLDWNISDFADLLYFPNLKTLNLGKNRYVRTDLVSADNGMSRVTDPDLCNWVLEKLHELNGLTVYRYDNHYNTLKKTDFIKEMGHHSEPVYSMVDLSGAEVTVTPDEDDDLKALGWSSHVERLTDGDDNTFWAPYQRSSSTTFTIDIRLPRAEAVRGIRLVQTYYDDASSSDRAKNPSMVKLYTSTNGAYFALATNNEETTIGNSTGEVNYIPFAKADNVNYVRLVVTTPLYFRNYAVSFAELGLYK